MPDTKTPMMEYAKKRVEQLKDEVARHEHHLVKLNEEVGKYNVSIISRRGAILELERLLNGGKNTNP